MKLALMLRLSVLMVLTLAADFVLADIYRHVAADGSVHFTNVPQDSRFSLYLREKEPASPVRETLSGAIRRYAEKDRARYAKHIQAAAKANRLEAALIHAVISAESGYNPFARSPKGATGLMQLMPQTAKRYGVKNSLDPAQNIRGGSRYLADLIRLFNNDVHLAVAAYNAGENAVMKFGNRIPPYQETMIYVPRVMNYYRTYRAAS